MAGTDGSHVDWKAGSGLGGSGCAAGGCDFAGSGRAAAAELRLTPLSTSLTYLTVVSD